MRFWYDCDDQRERASGSPARSSSSCSRSTARCWSRSLAAAPLVSTRMLGVPGYTLALQLVLLNTFAIGFTFIPFHVLRIEQRTRDVQRADLRALAGHARPPPRPRRRLSARRSGASCSPTSLVTTAVMRRGCCGWFAPLDPAGVLRRRAARVAGVRAAAGAARAGAAGDGGRRPLHPEPLRHPRPTSASTRWASASA